jgi:hypothetical protein
MAADEVLRLAWFADRDGRAGRRDALVTLALTVGAAENAAWTERARAWLIARRPDHVFAAFPTIEAALANEQVAEALMRLGRIYPPGRVRWLLQRAAVRQGPYTGRRESLAIVLDDLFRSRKQAGDHSGRGAASDGSTPPLSDETRAELTTFYLTVLLAIAVLLDSVLRRPGQGNKAA